MNSLLWACVLYFGGIAAVLYFRPTLMFNKDGEWREFGFNHEEKTIFPLWLFCIVWAIVSYLIVHSISRNNLRNQAILPIQSTATMSAATPFLISEPNRARRNNTSPVKEMQKGYYMLNTEGSSVDGVPKYVFIGTGPDAPDE
jgi:hypothetical protein